MQIVENFALKDYNTFGFEAKASFFVEIKSEADLVELYQSELFKTTPFFILGGGSNVLFTQDFKGLVIYVNIKGIQTISENDSNIEISVAAGEVWSDFVDEMVLKNRGGIENLALIPGFCGSCAVQNIGAYGVEICDSIKSIRYFNLETGIFNTIDKSKCNYDYRDSIFKHELKNKAIITSVLFNLTKQHKTNTTYGALQQELAKRDHVLPTIQEIAEIVKGIRSSKLPDVKELGNAGSFFKNPYLEKSKFEELKQIYPNLISYPVNVTYVKLAAGQLIELCGWKGKTINHVGVHAKQALILVHYGGGIGDEIVTLSNQIIDDVYQKFEVKLSPEVIFV